tara:strand:- start:1613 stop:1804 length:192 start_codon:yes stop_codon:yes gene_type:complete
MRAQIATLRAQRNQALDAVVELQGALAIAVEHAENAERANLDEVALAQAREAAERANAGTESV